MRTSDIYSTYRNKSGCFGLKEDEMKKYRIIPGIAGRGGARARCELINTTEMLFMRSLIDGNGSKCAKCFFINASSRGKYMNRRMK